NPASTLADLQAAARAGMILLRADERWDFVHDRVREASHALLPADERAAAHLRIGKMMLATTPEDRLSERIFSIVDHLDTGRSLITDPDELAQLARLAEIAGLRAQMATAYQTAVRYFRAGIECLVMLDGGPKRAKHASGMGAPGESQGGWPAHRRPAYEEPSEPSEPSEQPSGPIRAWRDHYDLTLSLHRHLAIAEYLSDDVPASLGRIATALEHARDAVDRVELFDLLVFQHTMATRYEQALATGRAALALLDIHLPETPTEIERALAAALAEYRERLGGRPVASLIALPKATRRATRAARRRPAPL